MTRVCFGCSAGEYTLRITGHAGFCPGNDIVCAAVSTLACTLAATLDALGADVTALRMEPGDVIITAHAGKGVETAFLMVRTGLRQLAEAYPKNVKFT